MRILSIEPSALDIPFRDAFEHSSARREATSAILVAIGVSDSISGLGEGCPRPYVTGETVEGGINFIRGIAAQLRESVSDVAPLLDWLQSNRALVDQHPAAWCAVELALLDAIGKSSGKPLEQLLGLPRLQGSFSYSAVLGVSSERIFDRLLDQYLQAGFTDYKLKLSGDTNTDRARIQAIHERLPNARLRVDANNLWSTASEAIDYFRLLDRDILAIEEPVVANDIDSMLDLYHATGKPVILDESCLRAAQIQRLPHPAEAWIINIRVSKMGGMFRSLEAVKAARARGHRIIVGAQVGETSILTRAALAVARAAGDALIAQEGAFGTRLLEKDVCTAPLMFAARGVLEEPVRQLADRPGLGLTFTA